jgi:cytosine/adenosine deaminase-related metal-dependent hydrolase
VLVEDDQVRAVGSGAPPAGVRPDRRIDATARSCCRARQHAPPPAADADAERPLGAGGALFRWLTELYQLWRHGDADAVDAAARVGLGELLLTGCTTSTDHLYLFPAGQERLIDVEIEAARDLGIRFHPTRGSMSRGVSQGRPAAGRRRAGRGRHPRRLPAPRPGAPRPAAARDDAHRPRPCSPFSVTDDLMRRTADSARSEGVRLHTHLAETLDEDAYCLAHYGCRPAEYLRRLGWLGDDVWLAHCVHLNDDEVALFRRDAHRRRALPSSNFRLGSGIAPYARCWRPACRSVSASTARPATTRRTCWRRRGRRCSRHRVGADPERWITAEEALWMATRGGAACLGRDDIGSLEPGKAADLILVDLRRLSYAGAGDDPLARSSSRPGPRRSTR